MKNLNPIYLLDEGKYSSKIIKFLDTYLPLPLWHTRVNQIASNTRLNKEEVARLARNLKMNTATDAINKTKNPYSTERARLALNPHIAKFGFRGLNKKDSIEAVLNSTSLTKKQKEFIIKMIKNGEPLNNIKFFDIGG